MAMVNITINGRSISVPDGITILKAARQAGIDIPTLCDHPALAPVGGCRMCVVELEGLRTLQTACTYPVSEGIVVQTESPRVLSARKLVIDMLFSERNHFCMYCEASGNCELQSMGYRLDVDHWVYPTYTKPFPLDATHKYLFMDHNRCILCGRCVRGCGDRVANHTLGLRDRGTSSMIHADANLRWGESTCISCGTCLQVCPTGAISEKRCAFMGRDEETNHIKSTCDRCSVGCGIEIVTRGGNVLRIRGDWDGAVNGGLLCKLGRFEPLDETRRRITEPMLRRNGRLEPVGWKDALQALAKRLAKCMDGTAAGEIGVLASSHTTNEAFYLLERLFRRELQATNIGLLNKVTMKPFGGREGSLADIETGDLILVAGADPVNDQPVSSYFVKRAFDKGTRIILVDDDAGNGLGPFATMNLGIAEIDQAVAVAERAEHPIILYGSRLAGKAAEALKRLNDKATCIALEPGANTRGAEAFGFDRELDPSGVKFLYVVLGEQEWTEQDLLGRIDRKAFLAVQAGFTSPLTEQRADLVLPAAIWSERSGSLTNTEGRILQLRGAVDPAGGAKADWEILCLLADRLGRPLGSSLDEISSSAALAVHEMQNRERRNPHGKN
ncbi:MAG: NADH-quinone oxidoreductase subunit 3 [Syntrophaceae bacterium PtaU1.Bin231]|nr:MAG: NADH-quinone oxidoreductase subunit 3 [Syntrophaceae bacterium PtaU1.Bin231]